MNADDFVQKWRPLFLGLLAEAYCLRKAEPSIYGMLMDQQFGKLEALLRRMHADLTADPPKPLPVNGTGSRAVAGKVG